MEQIIFIKLSHFDDFIFIVFASNRRPVQEENFN